MSKKRTLAVVITTCLLLFAMSVDCFAQAGCGLLDKGKPAQYISFESFSQINPEVKLRLRNNTSCSLIVETDDKFPIQIIKLQDGRIKVEAVVESIDGLTVPLHYLVQKRRRGRAPESAYGWGDSVFTYEITAGQSILFIVPLKHFKNRLDIVVPFKYSWESNSAIGMGTGGINHHIYYLAGDLPGEIIRRY